MKYYALLVTNLETEMPKKWKDLTDKDFEEMDKKAYEDLKHLVETSDQTSLCFRHFKTLDGFLDQVE